MLGALLLILFQDPDGHPVTWVAYIFIGDGLGSLGTLVVLATLEAFGLKSYGKIMACSFLCLIVCYAVGEWMDVMV